MAQVSFAADSIRPSRSRSRVRHSNTFPKSSQRRPGTLGVPGKPMRASVKTPRSQTCVEFGSCLPKQVSHETDYSPELHGTNNNLPPTAVIDEGRQPSPVDQHLHWLEGKLRELQVITGDQTANNTNQSNDNRLSQDTEPAIPTIPREVPPTELKKQPNYYCIAVQDLESSADDATPGNNTPDWDSGSKSYNLQTTSASASESSPSPRDVDVDVSPSGNGTVVTHNPVYTDWTPTEEQMSNLTPTSPTNLPKLLVNSPGSSQRHDRLDFEAVRSEPRLNGGQAMAAPGTAVKICNDENAATNKSGFVSSSRLNIANGVNGRLSTGESVSPVTSPSISNPSPVEPGQGFPLGLNLTLSIFGPEGSVDNIVGEDLWEFDGFSDGAMSTPTAGGSIVSSKSATPQDPDLPPPPGCDKEEQESKEQTVRDKRQTLQTLNVETWSMDTSSGLPPSPADVDVFSSASSICSKASHNAPGMQEIPREEYEGTSLASASSQSLSRARSASQSRSVSPSVSRSKSWTSSKRASFKKFVLDKAKAKLSKVNLRRGKVVILCCFYILFP